MAFGMEHLRYVLEREPEHAAPRWPPPWSIAVACSRQFPDLAPTFMTP